MMKGFHIGWVVLIATTYINMMVDGYTFVFGRLRIYLQEDYPDYQSWMIAIIGGVVPTIFMGIAPVTMAINDFVGPTRCIICASLLSTIAFILSWLNLFFKAGFYFDFLMLGVFQGLSSALLYGPSIAVVAQYFPPHQRSLAAGITTCGSPIGAIFYNAIIMPLCDAFGWRGAIAIFGGISLQAMICALAFLQSFKPSKEDLCLEQHSESKADLIPFKGMNGTKSKQAVVQPERNSFGVVLKMYFNPTLVFQWSALCLLGAAGSSIIGFYIPPLLVFGQSRNPDFHVSPLVQENLMQIWGVLNTLGRIVSGRLGDLGIRFKMLTSFWIFVIGSIISGLLLLIFPWVMFFGDFAFVTFEIIYGFCVAPLIAMRSIIVSDLYGEENASAMFGWFLCIQGLVQIVGYPMSAFLDSLSPLYAYVFGAACFLLAGAFVIVTLKPYFAMRRKTIEQLEKAKSKNFLLDENGGYDI